MFTLDVCGDVTLKSVGLSPGGEVIGSRFQLSTRDFLMGLIRYAVESFYRPTLLGELYSTAFWVAGKAGKDVMKPSGVSKINAFSLLVFNVPIDLR